MRYVYLVAIVAVITEAVVLSYGKVITPLDISAKDGNDTIQLVDKPDFKNTDKCQMGINMSIKCPTNNGKDTEWCFKIEVSLCGWPWSSSKSNISTLTSETTTESIAAASQNPRDAKCPSKGRVKVAHESDCALYYECNEGQKSGPHSCRKGHYFNSIIGTCDLKENVHCTLTTPTSTSTTTKAPPSSSKTTEPLTSTTTPKPSTSSPTTTDSSTLPSTSPSSSPPTTTKPSTTTETAKSTSTSTETTATTPQNPRDPVCPEKGRVNVAHESDCALYYECHEGQKSGPYPCREGHYFDPIIGACDLKENVHCTLTTPTSTSTTTTETSESTCTSTETTATTPQNSRDPMCPEKGRVKVAHESDCALYYECNEGQKSGPHSCREGHYFNPIIGTCDLKENVHCTLTTPTSTSTTTKAPPSSSTTTEPLTSTTTPKPSTSSPTTTDSSTLPSTSPSSSPPTTTKPSTTTETAKSTSTSTETTATTPQNPRDPVCPEKGRVNVAHESDCALYYECHEGQKSGPYPCREGHYFDPIIGACDLKENVHCTLTTPTSTSTTTKASTEPSTLTSTTSSTTTETSESTCTSTETTATTPQNPRDPVCPEKGRVNVAHESDCALYYECNEGQKSGPYPCREGHYFNPIIGACDLKENVHCTLTTPTSTSTTTKAPSSSSTSTEPSTSPSTTTEPSTLASTSSPTNTEPSTSTTPKPSTSSPTTTESSTIFSTTTEPSTSQSTTTGTSNSTSTSTETTATTPQNPRDPVCPEKGRVKVVHESDCALYYECNEGQKSGPYPCREGHYFNPIIGACDLKENVHCTLTTPTSTSTTTKAPSSSSTSTEPSTSPSTTTEPSTSTTTPKPSTSSPTTTESSAISSTSTEPSTSPSTTTEPSTLTSTSSPTNTEPSTSTTPKPSTSSPTTTESSTIFSTTTEPSTSQSTTTETSNSTSTSTETTATTPQNPRDPVCPEKGRVKVVHESDCALYYECNEGQKSGPYSCREGHYFNPIIGACDLKENVHCTLTTPTSTSTTTKASSSSSNTIQSSMISSTTTKTTTLSTTTTKHTTNVPDNVVCPPGKVINVADDRGDCQSYYLCLLGTKTGPLRCADGFFFDSKTASCQITFQRPVCLSKSGSSSQSTTVSTRSSKCPPTGILNVPDEKQCSKYYTCINGLKLPPAYCLPGYNFNTATKVCDLAANVRDCP